MGTKRAALGSRATTRMTDGGFPTFHPGTSRRFIWEKGSKGNREEERVMIKGSERRNRKKKASDSENMEEERP